MENTIDISSYIGKNIYLLAQSKILKSMHTIIRDCNATQEDFAHYSNRIIRLLIEESLNHVLFEDCSIITPVGDTYNGLRITSKLCGVSVIRSGDSMVVELGCIFKSLPIGKVLIQRDKVTKLPHLYYYHFPDDINKRYVLLLEPMLATGGSACMAIDLLINKGVDEDKIIFINFIAAPEGIDTVCKKYSKIKIITSSIEKGLNNDAYMMPGIGDFGDRFFGTNGKTNLNK